MNQRVFTTIFALGFLVALSTGALAQGPHAGHHPSPAKKGAKKKKTGCGCCDKCKMMQGGKGMAGMHDGMMGMMGKGMMGGKKASAPSPAPKKP